MDAATALATARRAALLAVDMLIDPLRAADEPPRRFFEHMHYVYIERRLRSSKTDAALSLWNRAFFEKMSEAETPLRGHVRHCLRLWKLNTSAGKSLCNLCR